MLGRGKISKPTVGVTGTFEGLTSMGAGAFVAAVLLLAFAIKNDNLGWRVYLLIPLALMPLGLRGLNRLVARIYDRRKAPDAPRWPRVGFFTLLGGVLNASVGWMLLGVSFWMILQGLRSEPSPWDWEHVGHLTAINALGYVIGFLALFMPAGAGVREAIIQYMLTYELTRAGFPSEGEGFAAVVAIVMRLVWTTAELSFATLLYFAVPAPKEEAEGDLRHLVVE
jgi:glycosyltransferase 2 family protein